MKDPIWIENINILFQKDRLFEFVPKHQMDINSKLNAIVRFSIYLTLVLLLYNFNYLNLYIVITVMALTYIIYNYKHKKFKNYVEKIPNLDQFIDNKYNSKSPNKCRKSTKDNPFMNRLLNDNENISACDPLSENTQQQIEDNFNTKLYMDIGDVFQNNNSQRQYYTTPVNSNVNKQTDFAQWLYSTPDTCKEGNGNQCIANMSSPFLADTAFKNKYH